MLIPISMKISLAAVLLAATALLSSCDMVDQAHRPAVSNPDTKPWAPTADSQAGEILEGAPQPPRR